MPLYNFTCSSCSNTTEINKKISDRDVTNDLICPNCSLVGTLERNLSAPMVGYSITVNGGYGSKVPSGFKDVLKKIHENSPGSRMDKTSSFM